jgi:hypothetical protein
MVPRRLGRSGGLRSPTGICHRLIVPITLAFLDQNDMESLEVAELFVDRMWKSKRKIASRGSGLFECLEAPTSRNLSTPQTVSGGQVRKRDSSTKNFRASRMRRSGPSHSTHGWQLHRFSR